MKYHNWIDPRRRAHVSPRDIAKWIILGWDLDPEPAGNLFVVRWLKDSPPVWPEGEG